MGDHEGRMHLHVWALHLAVLLSIHLVVRCSSPPQTLFRRPSELISGMLGHMDSVSDATWSKANDENSIDEVVSIVRERIHRQQVKDRRPGTCYGIVCA
jgi:hypothetical protein